MDCWTNGLLPTEVHPKIRVEGTLNGKGFLRVSNSDSVQMEPNGSFYGVCNSERCKLNEMYPSGSVTLEM